VKLLRRAKSGGTADAPVAAAESPDTGSGSTSKGRPTPKRRDAETRRRGPIAAPMTAKEARARRKATRAARPGGKADAKLTPGERKASRADQRARMMAGEDAYLLPRDRGEARAYVRDIVDARRNLVGMFMPLALVLILTMFLSPTVQYYVTFAMLAMMALMAIEAVILGRLVNSRVRERFPKSDDGGARLGWYAFVRASQIRWMRAPKPRVKTGDAV
jgi:hypothetical protein